MIFGLRSYPEYKDSAVPWLGGTPAHWLVRRLGASVTDCVGGIWGDEPNGIDDLVCVRVADFDRVRLGVRTDNLTVRAIPPSERRRRLLMRGDLLLEKSGGGDSQPVGVVVLFQHDFPAVCSNFLARMPVAAGYDPRYLAYLHAHLYAIRLNVRSIKQTTGIQNINTRAYLSEPVAFPPYEEQAVIARFLDHADRRIRRYIHAKQKLVKLLEEQKQTIIHRTVTRGLDPSVLLRPSGVDFLGDIPAHWDVVQLRRRWQVIDCKHVTVPFVDEGVPLASVREVQDFDLDLTDCKRTTEEWYAHLVSGGRTPRRGDLIYCRNVSVGACAYVNTDERFAMGQDVCVIRSDAENGRYLNYVMHSTAMERQLSLLLIGSTFDRINVSAIKALVIPVPPRPEQDSIVSFLDAWSKTFNAPVAAARRDIQLMGEYRTRLIADVVTGKLDVRTAAAGLPEECDELAALDDADAMAEGETMSYGDLEAAPVEVET